MAFLGGLLGGVAPFPQTYQTPQNIKDFMQPIPVSEMQAASIAQNLLGAKQGYDTAQKSMDLIQNALQTPDVGEDMRNKWQRQLNEYTQARDAAAQTANSLRNTAATLGIDVSDYGSDKTLQESNQAFQNHKQMAFKNFLNLPTQKELEDDLYAQARLRGASPRTAEAIVSEERGAIKQQLARRLNDFMGTYGKNPDGSIDQDVGIAAIGSVLQDPQQVAQLFVSGFAMPQKVYDTNNDMAKMAIQSDWLDKRLAQQVAIEKAKELARRKNLIDTLNAREKIVKYQEDQANARNSANNENRRYIANLTEEGANYRSDSTNQTKRDIANQTDQRTREIETAKINVNSPAGKFTQLYQLRLAANGGNHEDAFNAAMQEIFTHGEKKGSKSQRVFNIFDTMFSLIAQGDIDSAGEMLERLDTNRESDELEFYEQFDRDKGEHTKFNDLFAAFKEYLDVGRNPDATDTKTQADAYKRFLAKYKAAQRGTYWGDEYAALSNANHNAKGNEEKQSTEYDDMEQANRRLRALLGDNNSTNGNTQSAQNVTPQIGGVGYAGTYNPTNFIPWVSPYGNYSR